MRTLAGGEVKGEVNNLGAMVGEPAGGFGGL